jgi:hypothetical protein
MILPISPSHGHYLDRCVYPLVPSSFPPVCMHTYRVIESNAAAFGYYQSLLIVTLLPATLAKDPFVPSFPD